MVVSKRIVFRLITLIPLLSILATVLYFLFLTNLPQLLYAQSVRNLPFDCQEFSPAIYVYKMKPGKCRMTNIEYDVVVTSDVKGFRNGIRVPTYADVAVIGDSHAFGFGVQDNQTFASLLESTYHYKTINLAIPSYASARELEVLKEYGKDAKYVVMQYCPNDFSENEAFIRLSREDFRAQGENQWRSAINIYQEGKSHCYQKPLRDLAVMLKNHTYDSKSGWRKLYEQNRPLEKEATAFAQIIAQYRSLLEGKRLLLFEVAPRGANSPRFEGAFAGELNRMTWLNYQLLNTAQILTLDDYFFLDDHINQSGHDKLAKFISEKIEELERRDPLIENQFRKLFPK